MGAPRTDLSDIVARLARVEKENAMLKRAGLVLMLIAGALLVLGAAQPRRVFEADEFALRDTNGRIRARLAMSVDKPTLTFVDAKGMPQVGLTGGQEPFLTLNPSNGEQQVTLSSGGEMFGLALYGKDTGTNHGIRAGFSVFKGVPGLSLYNEGGNEQVGLSVMETGPLFSMSDASGKPRTTLDVTPDTTSFSLSDKAGFQTTIGTTDLQTLRTGEKRITSAASITLFGKDGKTLWSAP